MRLILPPAGDDQERVVGRMVLAALAELGATVGGEFLIAVPARSEIAIDAERTGPSSSPTSRAAAEAMYPLSSQQRRAVYDFIVARGERGATRAEITEAKLKTDKGVVKPKSVDPRVWELVKGGWIRAAAEPRRGAGSLGTDVEVLVATDQRADENGRAARVTPPDPQPEFDGALFAWAPPIDSPFSTQ